MREDPLSFSFSMLRGAQIPLLKLHKDVGISPVASFVLGKHFVSDIPTGAFVLALCSSFLLVAERCLRERLVFSEHPLQLDFVHFVLNLKLVLRHLGAVQTQLIV